MKVSDFSFDLPEHLIAKHPAAKRSGSRLLHLDAVSGKVVHLQFTDLPRLLNPEDLMVFNNTRVIPARFFGRKETGGKVELLLERIVSKTEAMAQIRVSKPPKAGSTIYLEGGASVTVMGKEGSFYRVRFPAAGVSEIATQFGHMPLPPYIDRADEVSDQSRYQTVYAQHDGAVAAPTAGLHFDEKVLADIAAKSVRKAEVTLHVGAGTFQPVRTENVEEHQMHREFLDVSRPVCVAVEECRKRRGRVVAVGTTSVRSLESASSDGSILPFRGDTEIFIYPGYEFRSVDAMVTNFHLPGSTLLMLISAFAGTENIKNAYQCAIEESYRFFSYGDAMLITR